jgi:hypothetical protein
MCPSESKRCQRCGRIIGGGSAFAILLWAEGESLLYDVVFAQNTPKNSTLMHMSADRECRGEISGYVGKLLRNLGLPETCDTSSLDTL